MADGRRLRGERTRQAILREAVDVASVEGLEGLSIGRLSAALGVSKSGLFAHFGSKQELQLETIDAAAELFEREIADAVQGLDSGLPRLLGLFDAWLAYFRHEVFRGGCFFTNVQAEFDARPGPVRDRIAAQNGRWLAALLRQVQSAQSRGEIRSDANAELLAFEIDAFGRGANSRYQLHGDVGVFGLAAAAVRRTLASAATEAGQRRLAS